MRSIRRTLLVWLLLGLGRGRGAGDRGDLFRHPARDRRALRPAAEAACLFDAHRRPAPRPAAEHRRTRRRSRDGRVRNRHADLGPRRRARLLFAPRHRPAGAGDRGLQQRHPRRPRVARLHARRRAPRAAGRARAGRAARDRRAIGVAHAAAAGRADSVPGRAHLVRSRPRPAAARDHVARGGQAPARRDGAARRKRTARGAAARWPAASMRCSRASTTRSTRSAASPRTPRTNCARRLPR